MKLNITTLSFQKNDLYLEVYNLYNCILFFLGIVAVILSILKIYIIVKHKLHEASLFNYISLFSCIGGLLCGVYNLFCAVFNAIFINEKQSFYYVKNCLWKSIFETFSLHLFQISFLLQCFSFMVMILFPMFYKLYLNKKEVSIITGLFLVSFSIAPCALLLSTIDGNKKIKFCSSYSSWTKAFETYYDILSITLPVVMFLSSILTYAVFKTKSQNDKTRKSTRCIISMLHWLQFFFYVCWCVPNLLLLVAEHFEYSDSIKSFVRNLYSLGMNLTVIAKVPFSVWKNKEINEHFYKLQIVQKFCPPKPVDL